jgi:hypothetical protein
MIYPTLVARSVKLDLGFEHIVIVMAWITPVI